MSASEVAQVFGLHRTAGRAQLERLCELGLVSVVTHDRASPAMRSKRYAAIDVRLEFTLPQRRYEQLSRLLLDLLLTLPPEKLSERAAAVGRAHGAHVAAELAGEGIQTPVKLSLPALVTWMNRSGYQVTLLSSDGAEAALEVRNCVYRELSLEHRDVVCAFDRGVLCGMLGVDLSSHRQTHAIGSGDSCCRHVFSLCEEE